MQFVHQDAKKFFRVAERSDGSGHADERFVPHGKWLSSYDFRVVVHSGGHHSIKLLPVRLMPGEGQLIHLAESGKDVYVVERALPRGDAPDGFQGDTPYGLTEWVASVGRGFLRDSSDAGSPSTHVCGYVLCISAQIFSVVGAVAPKTAALFDKECASCTICESSKGFICRVLR